MVDLHTHSILSDGELLPSELARRYEEKGFQAIAITDHVDFSNLESVSEKIVRFCREWPDSGRIKVYPGVELTHLPLDQYEEAVRRARAVGIQVIIAHGETIVEPVFPGTTKAALESGIDILSHPGLISEDDVKLALQNGIFLELSARGGHCLGNGRVASLALKLGAKLCINSDSHLPQDIPTIKRLEEVGLGAGLGVQDLLKVREDVDGFLESLK